MFAKTYFFFLIYVKVSSTLHYTEASGVDQIKTISEGRNCHCKCILNVEDGPACQNDPNNRRLIYSMDTISNGEGCKCSCLVPTPKDPCKSKKEPKVSVPIAEDANGNVMSLEISSPLFDFNGTDKLINISDMLQKTLNLMKVIKIHLASSKLEKILNQMEQIVEATSGPAETELNDRFMKVMENLQNEQLSSSVSEDEITSGEESHESNETFGQFVATSTTKPNSTDGSLFSNVGVNQSSGTANKSPSFSATAGPLEGSAETSNITNSPNGDSIATNQNISNDGSFDATEIPLFVYNSDKSSAMPERYNISTKPEHESSSSLRSISPTAMAKTQDIFVTNSSISSGVKVLAGSYELYRKSDDPVVIKKEHDNDEYYDEEYYDYSDEDDNTSIVHPSVRIVTSDSSLDSSPPDNLPQGESGILSTEMSTSEVISVSATTQSTQDSSEDNSDYYETYEEYLSAVERKSSPSPTTTTQSSSVQYLRSLDSGDCGTLLNLSSPKIIHDFGRREGAWMRDFAGKRENQNSIYVTNFYYGNNLMEFTSLQNFKDFRWSKSYLLPYNWMGTGHIVYNGSFYYNRAFSRNIIKYDLKYRYVTAWGSLRDAKYDVATTFSWRGHTMAHMAADENGLWVVYPSRSYTAEPNRKTFVINQINPIDLRVLNTWKISPSRHSVSHMFIVCGVVYVTDRYDRSASRITYAYDTYTRESRHLLLPFVNLFSYNVQLLYDPDQKQLLSWDNGHQIIYDINYTY